ncbi:hypothetical protein AMK68_04170 [candidate division KD3-62 bacterium DG_56]|uniref:Alpha-amylase n=1 Tax=candidate division KD3-62 bacterium DG_56 TaxID=1704032 RepID=A0A0S7XMK0_9BACT|nr:MAG: hypothetical protein AMK68_04170 [candidate division KD3-62 bacterium DG_56]
MWKPVLLGILLCLAMSPPAVAQEAPPEALGSIRGTVKNTAGKPIEGATVKSVVGPESLGPVLSGPDGTYSLNDVPVGSYELVAAAPDHGSEAHYVVVEFAGHEAVADFILDVEGTIHGRVIDADTEQGIEGAQVTASSRDSAGDITDGDGFYTVRGLAASIYEVRATKEGYTPNFITDVDVNAGEQTTPDPIRLTRTGSVSGVVTDEDQNPIDHASVEACPFYDGMVWPTDEFYAFSNADGSFEITNVDAGEYYVYADKEGYGSAGQGPLTVTAGGTISDLALALPRAGAITGRVTDSKTGAPLGSVMVEAMVVHPFRWAYPEVETIAGGQDEGRYTIAGLTPGTYTLTSYHPDYSRSQVTTVVNPGETTTDVNISMAPLGAIGGTVTDKATGDPVPGAVIYVMYKGRTLGDFKALTSGEPGHEGDYLIRRLEPLTYFVSAEHNGLVSEPAEAVVVSGETTIVDLELQATDTPAEEAAE